MKSRSRFVDSFTASCLICKLAGLHFETRWISAAASLGAASRRRLEQLVSGVRGNEDQEGDRLSSEISDFSRAATSTSPALSAWGKLPVVWELFGVGHGGAGGVVDRDSGYCVITLAAA
jgi:hypothetical protein